MPTVPHTSQVVSHTLGNLGVVKAEVSPASIEFIGRYVVLIHDDYITSLGVESKGRGKTKRRETWYARPLLSFCCGLLFLII
jgi:hypothetical protein